MNFINFQRALVTLVFHVYTYLATKDMNYVSVCSFRKSLSKEIYCSYVFFTKFSDVIEKFGFLSFEIW